MYQRVKDIVGLMEEIAPPKLAENWDNVGLLIGDGFAPVKKVMVTLDVTKEVIEDAAEKNVDMIISHHPVIFKPIKEISSGSFVGAQLLSLIKSGIAVYCAHTNLDKADGGVDDTLAEAIGLMDIKSLTKEAMLPGFENQPTFGRIGRLEEKQPLEVYLYRVKDILKSGNVDYIGDPNREIQTVASCAGSGADFIALAEARGADLFITGEAKYHDLVPQLDGSIAVAVFGHYATEQPALIRLIKRLQNSCNALQYKIEIIPSKYYGHSWRRLKE